MICHNFLRISRPTLANLCDYLIKTLLLRTTEWNFRWYWAMLAIIWNSFFNAAYHNVWLCCIPVPVLVAMFPTTKSWHTKCIGIFPKFSELMCLPVLTLGVPHMACNLQILAFRKQAIYACPIESTEVVVSLPLDDFLSHGWNLYCFDNTRL